MPRCQARARWLKPEVLLAGVIVLLALGARLAWVLYSEASPTDGRFDDSLLYHLLAIGLRDDLRYVQPFTGLPTATWPPGYPAFLAGVYSLFGVSATAATVVNAFLGALTVAGLYVLGRLLFDQRTAALGAFLLAVMPGQIFFTGILWSEVLFTLLFTLTLISVIAAPRRPAKERLIWAAGVGVLVAGSAYVREAGLALLIVAAIYWAWALRDWRASLRGTGTAALVAALLIVPWAVRNTVQLQGPIVLSSSTGTNFWRGHHDGASGGFDPLDPLLRRSKPITEPRGEADLHQRGMREGLRFLARHPVRELTLFKEKIRLLYKGDRVGLTLTETAEIRFLPPKLRTALGRLADSFFYAVLALAGLAMLRWARERGGQPFLPAVTVLVLTLGHAAFWGSPRFHYPLIPLFCLLAGWALSGLWEQRSWAARLAPSVGASAREKETSSARRSRERRPVAGHPQPPARRLCINAGQGRIRAWPGRLAVVGSTEMGPASGCTPGKGSADRAGGP